MTPADALVEALCCCGIAVAVVLGLAACAWLIVAALADRGPQAERRAVARYVRGEEPPENWPA